MSSGVSSPAQKCATTLRLAPILGATTLRRDRMDLTAVRVGRHAVVFASIVGENVIAPGIGVWCRDGTPMSPTYPALLAWRLHDGPWTTLDPEVTNILQEIDNEL